MHATHSQPHLSHSLKLILRMIVMMRITGSHQIQNLNLIQSQLFQNVLKMNILIVI